MLITITDFADGRNTDRDTVNAYIRKHPEIKAEVKRDGKNSVIDTDTKAFSLLEKQYPLPQMVQVIEDTESRKQLIEAQKAIIQLQNKLTEQAQLIATAEATKLLLEDKKEQLEQSNKKLEKTEEELRTVRGKLEEEQNKSWLKKLFGK